MKKLVIAMVAGVAASLLAVGAVRAAEEHQHNAAGKEQESILSGQRLESQGRLLRGFNMGDAMTEKHLSRGEDDEIEHHIG